MICAACLFPGISRMQDPIIIVSHQATLRVLYSYLTDQSPNDCPDILIPLHTVIQLTPFAYGCTEVSTFVCM